MLEISCIIVDDERIAREGIEKYVAQIDFLKLKGTFKNALEANSFLSNNSVDLMFLDIEMPMLSGIDFLKSLHRAPYTIFTTAYSQYALEGYKYDVIDYLVKPISFERFLQAVNKLVRILQKQQTDQEQTGTPAAQPVSEETADSEIFIKTDKKIVKLDHSEILFLESMQNYVKIHTAKEDFTSRITLKNIMDALPESAFIQTHKSFVVAKSKIDAIEGNMIIINKHRIPISRRLKDSILSELTKNRLL